MGTNDPIVIHIAGDDARKMLCGATPRDWWSYPRDLVSAQRTVKLINQVPNGQGVVLCDLCKGRCQ